MKTNLVKFITAVGFFVLGVNVHAATSQLESGAELRPDRPRTLQAEPREVGKHEHDVQYRYAGGTGVGNPGTGGIQGPSVPGPVVNPRLQSRLDRSLQDIGAGETARGEARASRDIRRIKQA